MQKLNLTTGSVYLHDGFCFRRDKCVGNTTYFKCKSFSSSAYAVEKSNLVSLTRSHSCIANPVNVAKLTELEKYDHRAQFDTDRVPTLVTMLIASVSQEVALVLPSREALIRRFYSLPWKTMPPIP